MGGTLPRSDRRRVLIAAVFGLGLSQWIGSPLAAADPTFGIQPVGLTDATHQNASGATNNLVGLLNENGQVAGSAARYAGAPQLSRDAWVFFNGATTQIGLTNTDPTGYGRNDVLLQDDAGRIVGTFSDNKTVVTWLYAGGTTTQIFTANALLTSPSFMNSSGQIAGSWKTAWFYSNGTTTALGLNGPQYQAADGSIASAVVSHTPLNNAGQVLGVSYFDGAAVSGHSSTAWIYATGSTTPLGLTDALHTRSGDGLQSSLPVQLNQNGQAIGYSARYNSLASGNDSWIYSGGVVSQIGLSSPTGAVDNEPYLLNQAGNVAGISSLGPGAWFYANGVTTPIGLTDSSHQSSSPRIMNLAGQVAGIAKQFSNDGFPGQGTWLYTGGQTYQIGLVDAQHTKGTGLQNSAVEFLTESGIAAGNSTRYQGFSNTNFGQDAWISDGPTTTQLGLTGPAYRQANGYQYSEVFFVDNAGQAVGTTGRFSASGNGNDTWFYDPVSKQSHSLALPLWGGGKTDATANYLGDDGVVMGSYNSVSIGFYWKPGDGLFKLDELVPGGAASQGWVPVIRGAGLVGASAANSSGQIIGYGNYNSFAMPFLMTPALGRWTGAGGSDWSDAANWSNGVAPQGGAVINLPQGTSKTINFNADASLQAVNVTGGNVSWNLAGHTLALGGALRVGDSVATPTAILNVTGGTIAAAGDVNVFQNATLSGIGTIQGRVLVDVGGTLAPGNNTGTLHTLDMFLNPGSHLGIGLAGNGFGQAGMLEANGAVTIDGSNLDLSVLNGYQPTVGDSFVILRNDGSGPVTGRFANATNSGQAWDYVFVNGSEFRIDYNGGDGNDIAVTAVPEPGGLAVLGLLGLNLMRRRRRLID